MKSTEASILAFLLCAWKLSDSSSWLFSLVSLASGTQKVVQGKGDCSAELRKIIELQEVNSQMSWKITLLICLSLSSILLWLLLLLWITQCCACCCRRPWNLVQGPARERGRPLLEDAAPGPRALASVADEPRPFATAPLLQALGDLGDAADRVITPSTRPAAWKRM